MESGALITSQRASDYYLHQVMAQQKYGMSTQESAHKLSKSTQVELIAQSLVMMVQR